MSNLADKRQLTLHELSKVTGKSANTIKRLIALGLPTNQLGRSRDVFWEDYKAFITKHFGPDGDMRGQLDLDLRI